MKPPGGHCSPDHSAYDYGGDQCSEKNGTQRGLFFHGIGLGLEGRRLSAQSVGQDFTSVEGLHWACIDLEREAVDLLFGHIDRGFQNKEANAFGARRRGQ